LHRFFENPRTGVTRSKGKPIAYWHRLREFWLAYFKKAGAFVLNYSVLRETPRARTLNAAEPQWLPLLILAILAKQTFRHVDLTSSAHSSYGLLERHGDHAHGGLVSVEILFTRE